MSFRSRTFSVASHLCLTREIADLSWQQGAHLALTKCGSGSLKAPLIPNDYIFFAHLQGLDKTTFSTIQYAQYALLYSTSDKKKFTYLLKAEQPKKKSRFSPSPPTSTAEQGGAGSLSSVREGGG